MTGFSIATNAWGIHTILHKAMSATEMELWTAKLRGAAGCRGRSAGNWGVIVDIRSLDDAALLPALAAGLTELAGRTDVGRCAVIVADQGQAERFGRISAGPELARKTRVVAVAGRDRTQIAAAYTWTLNGTEPQLAQRLVGSRPSAGTILPFPKARTPQGSGLGGGLRKAS